MHISLDSPLFVFVASVLAQVLAAHIGRFIGSTRRGLKKQDERDDFGTLQAASLTLLGLIIGFSFSMAVGRYDQRKNLEEAEANAIGTEYARADLLLTEDKAKVRDLLRRYTDLRISFYLTHDDGKLKQIDDDTRVLQDQLWAAILPTAAKQPTLMVTLAVSGMNDVLNSQSYTQAAWWNRIPIAAWGMMGLIAVACNSLVGYGAHQRSIHLLWILPAIVSIAFFFMADIDSPRGGFIRVLPQNLMAQSQSMKVN